MSSKTNVDDLKSYASQDDMSVGKWRCILPQVLACLAMNVMIFGIGLSVGFPTIAIPALRGLQPEKYPNETIRLTAEESSWLGSLLFITEPLGSLFTGWITEQIGRKRSMFFASIPAIASWTILYFAQSTELVFVGAVLYGFGTGLLGAPVYTYCGEVTQPSIRGIMLTVCSLTNMVGIFSMFFLGSITTWRNASLVGLACPLITLVTMFFIPESPQWLLAHNRHDEAQKSLQWLRGWVPAANVASEMNAMSNFITRVNACPSCQRDQGIEKCSHNSGYFKKLKEVTRTNALRPMGLLLFCMCVIQSSGNAAIRPFLVQIFETFRIPMDANWGSVIMGFVDIASNLFCMFAIPIVGKRVIMLTGLTGVVIFCIGVAVNAYIFLDFGTSSFDWMPNSESDSSENHYVFALFICLGVSASISGCVPWLMNSEVYPFRVRGTATGITSAFGYITMFVATKTYINFENTLSIFGSFVLYGCLTFVGLIVLFTILPNTEGHSLEEIEQFFSNKSRSLTDWRIQHIKNTIDSPDTFTSFDNPVFVSKEI